MLDHTVGPHKFKLGYFEFLTILNSKPFPHDLPFRHVLSAILNSCYFNLSIFVFPESLK